MFAFFKSFHLLLLVEVSSISFASIMITTILAIYLLNEKVGLRRCIAIFVGFIGIVIILRSGINIFNLYITPASWSYSIICNYNYYEGSFKI